ncbi:hypothetical protein HQ447_17705, partial [bacterium]|nr:hypothetical protein [bacterium]
MEVPQPQGFEPGKLIGYGGCGKVYQVAGGTADGARVIKIFDDAAISRRLLAKMTERLRIGGWPGGVMPVIAADFEAKRAFWVTPLVAGVEEGVEPLPSTLQTWLAEHPGTYSLKLVRLMAGTLARMHERRVPHGNLKPGNVFFADGGGVLLSDWAMGNLPGAERFTFTDAVLYQAPEQLRNPAGYLDEEGYRWDVFSFGVLAYRILTGRFPRCHETFALVAPAAGETRRAGIQADLGKLAHNLEAQPAVSWPDESQNPLEAGFRDWIDRCLQLDPAKRPFTMVEVAAGFTALENQGIFDAEREALMDQRRAAERRAWRNWYFAGGVAAGAVLLGALWQMANRQLLDERSARQQDVSTITAANDTAVATQADAARKTAVLLQALHDDRDSALARLETARLIGDQLFAAAMEKGNRVLPPLDGRDLQLKRLERYFADFLTKSEATGGLAEERARVRLQLAEISLAAGDAPAAALRIAEATRAWEDLPMDGALKFRLAGMTLHLALLQQSVADPETDFSFMAARKALGEVPQTEVDADRLNQLLAILDFHEAQLLAAQGDETEALAQLMRASQTLNGIADRRPDAAILRSELAACYLASAT